MYPVFFLSLVHKSCPDTWRTVSADSRFVQASHCKSCESLHLRTRGKTNNGPCAASSLRATKGAECPAVLPHCTFSRSLSACEGSRKSGNEESALRLFSQICAFRGHCTVFHGIDTGRSLLYSVLFVNGHLFPTGGRLGLEQSKHCLLVSSHTHSKGLWRHLLASSVSIALKGYIHVLHSLTFTEVNKALGHNHYKEKSSNPML